jgi:hypothetical protein
VNQCIKYFLLPLVSLLLTFAGVHNSNRMAANYADAQKAAVEDDRAAIAGSELYKFPGLQRTEEQLGAAQHVPAAPAKNHLTGSGMGAYAHELRLQRLAAQYILRASHLHRSLTSCDIIFPFHSFW